jgi:hypothetical protein
MGYRFPPPTSLKQSEDVLQEEWYKIPLETVQNLYESIPGRTAAVLEAKVVQSNINKDIFFLLLCPTPVHTKFLKDWFRHSKANGGIHRHTDSIEIA